MHINQAQVLAQLLGIPDDKLEVRSKKLVWELNSKGVLGKFQGGCFDVLFGFLFGQTWNGWKIKHRDE